MKSSILLSAFLVFSSSGLLRAEPGKVFFSSERWLKGDIQIRSNDAGEEIVVISLPTGSVTVPKSEIKNIVFASGQSLADRKFHKAFANTKPSKEFKPARTAYDPYIQQASRKHGLDPHLVKAVIKQESNFNPRDVSNKGAVGLMQLMPQTAQGLGVRNSFDPYENIHGGTRYLKMMLEHFDGDLVKALAAYNAGPHAVRKYGSVPPYRETQDYVNRVLKYYRRYKGEALYSYRAPNGSLVLTDRP